MKNYLPIFLIVVLCATAFAGMLPVLQAAEVSGFTEKDGMMLKRDVPYVKDGKTRQQLDIFLPKDYLAAKKPLPVIVWIHGGGWVGGSKDNMDGAAKGLIENGYAFFSINYRFTSTDRFPAQIEDCKSAIRWIRAHAKEFNLDGDNIGVWGASAGGHLVALLGVTGKVKEFDIGENLDQSSAVQAVCDYFGPTDFVLEAEYPDFDRFESVRELVDGLFGGHPKDHKEMAAKASPLNFVHKDAAPILMFHGTADPLVPIEQSIEFDRALKKAGAESELVIFKKAGHGGGPFDSKETFEKISAFFAKHLK